MVFYRVMAAIGLSAALAYPVHAEACVDDRGLLELSDAELKQAVSCSKYGELYRSTRLDEAAPAFDSYDDLDHSYYLPSRVTLLVLADEGKSDLQKSTYLFGYMASILEMGPEVLATDKANAYLVFIIASYWTLTKGGGGNDERALLRDMLLVALNRSDLEKSLQAQCLVENDMATLTMSEVRNSRAYTDCLARGEE